MGEVIRMNLQMKKLNVVIMGQDCHKFIGMCLESVKDANQIIYCDGGSSDGTLGYLTKIKGDWTEKIRIIRNPYNQEDPKMNGKQRNFYLDCLKKHHRNEWCLVLDADEIVEDFSKLQDFVNTIKPEAEDILCSPKMRHLIGDFGHEDSTVPTHFVLHRLFKVREDLFYPELEHSVLNGKEVRSANIQPTTIWHLAYTPNMWDIKKRYDNHLAKSNMHTPEFLNQWYKAHLFGTYPTSQINPVELPSQLLDEFGIDKDELYFENRGLETNHFIDAIHWKDFFKCTNAIEFGCGKGPRVYAMKNVGIEAKGIEISEFAVNNKIHHDVYHGSVLDFEWQNFDLAIAYDLLEHISYEDLDDAIQNLYDSTNKHILVSVPVIGDPNLEADPTHIIKEDREWWVKQFVSKGLKEVEVPQHFLYREQLMIFEK